MKKFVITKNDSNQRLDKFVYKVTANLSGSLLYKYLRKKAIKVNGKKKEISYRLQENDVVEMYINDEFFEENGAPAFMRLKKMPNLDILYEDENVLILNKVPGLLVHEDDKEKTHTLINYVLYYLYQKGEYDPKLEQSFTPALCNRIDKNTGGIVLAAKNAEAGRELYDIIKHRKIQKYYLALVHGNLLKKEDILQAWHTKYADQNRVKISEKKTDDAKRIQTGYKVLDENDKESLLKIRLYTGRTHQIRAHMAYIGHSLLGDTKYGTAEQNRNNPFHHQALYAYKIKFDLGDYTGILQYLDQKEFRASHVYFENYIKEGVIHEDFQK